ncbi:TetR/AcrR family transcriptional regulator [Promicromonospora panici]|uniref:TetR/AcrR family transcriptional regulator n=1 Tax=Promicromonospora panici TaxID=2219658 RepID=UPI00101CBF85|nr:TetR/AcrR family transcriptional regulator [Promicromonospora panici]
MPKRVDHRERREQIAAALLRVAAQQGLEAVSLRHVATEAGVTTGMVQHYFPSKEAMMDYAMATVSDRYGHRMTANTAALGDEPSPADVVRMTLTSMIPRDDDEREDARVALAFQSYAAGRPRSATQLGTTNAHFRDYLAAQIEACRRTAGAGPRGGPDVDPHVAATALLATAEGLALHVLSSALSTAEAFEALDQQLALVIADAATPAR